MKDVECNSCAAGIEKGVKSTVKGVMDVSVNLLARRISVSYDTSVSSDEFVKASLEKVGVSVRYISHAERRPSYLNLVEARR